MAAVAWMFLVQVEEEKKYKEKYKARGCHMPTLSAQSILIERRGALNFQKVPR
jgi:hypothetical protein